MGGVSMTMGVLSDFVGQNYFWILIIGLMFIMALIGYIADKKNLVKLSYHRKDVKNNPAPLENLKNQSLAEAIYQNSKEKAKKKL